MSTLIALLGIGVGIAWYTGRIALRGITERNALARGLHDAAQQVLLRPPLHRCDRGRHQGPVARGVNWFNQNVIDGVVSGAGQLATASGRWVYTHVDQQVVDGAVNGSATAAQSGGQVFAS